MNRFVNWLCNKFYSCIYGEHPYARLRRYERYERYENSAENSSDSSDELINIAQRLITIPELSEESSDPDPDFRELSSESEPETELISEYKQDHRNTLTTEPREPSYGSEHNSIIIDSYRDDPIIRVSVPSPEI